LSLRSHSNARLWEDNGSAKEVDCERFDINTIKRSRMLMVGLAVVVGFAVVVGPVVGWCVVGCGVGWGVGLGVGWGIENTPEGDATNSWRDSELYIPSSNTKT